MKRFLAVDLGATSGRTVLAAFDGQKMEMTELTRFKNPMILLLYVRGNPGIWGVEVWIRQNFPID